MEYCLTDKSGEVINKVKTDNLKFAIEVFAKIKKLETDKLLEIYQVKENEKANILLRGLAR